MRFDWRAELALPADVQIVETAAMPAALRDQSGLNGAEYVIYRPGSRESAKAIDPEGVRVLQAFREPRRIVDVVAALARAEASDPERLLEEIFPLLRTMLHAGVLGVKGSQSAEPLRPSLEPKSRLGGAAIVECVRLIDDSEVYRARHGRRRAAVKLLRQRGVERGMAPLLAREAEALRRIGGAVAPRVLELGLGDSPPWIAMTWHDGVRPDQSEPGRDRMPVCLAIAEAYAALHRRGVLHGDVHPGNVLVDSRGRVRLIDFALAVFPGPGGKDAIRGAAKGYWEPEFAASVLSGRGEIPVTAQGEQYSVATLIDALLGGEEALELPAASSGHWHAILDGYRRSFAERGAQPWPAVEAVLRTAMAREPEWRFAGMDEFRDELRRAASKPPAAIRRSDDPAKEFLDAVAPGGALFEYGLAPPKSSFNFGAAGIAYALYRIARAREDGALLSLAEVWQQRAEDGLATADGLYDRADFRREDLGAVSPYHAETGVHLTRALLSRAMGDAVGIDRAIEAYLRCVEASPAEGIDLTLGSSAALVGAALLYEIRPAPALRRLGDGLLAEIWRKINAQPAIPESALTEYLGIAHGWAGFVYAALAWARVTASPPPAEALERLAQISELTEGKGQELRAPVRAAGGRNSKRAQFMDGWCHGQAGHAFLRLLGARLTGSAADMDAASRLAAAAFAGTEDIGNLCCGLAGRAYAMLAMYRATGHTSWLEKARRLSSKASAGTYLDRWPNSLYKGRTGLAVLAAELDNPWAAGMPLFEDERWMEA
jgi:serine/threonine-protein kinase